MSAKWLQLVQEVVPQARHIAVLWDNGKLSHVYIIPQWTERVRLPQW
jgi:hypothetical protein